MLEFEVETEHDGKTFKGQAIVDKGIITVHSGSFGQKSASCKSSVEASTLAKILLGELIRQNEGRGW